VAVGVVGVLFLVVIGGAAWWYQAAENHRAFINRLNEAAAAIDRGDYVLAEGKLTAAAAIENDDPRLVWLNGRVALGKKDYTTAARLLAKTWKVARSEAWHDKDRATVANDAVAALRGNGQTKEAAAFADAAIGELADLIDRHFDRSDLDRSGLPPTTGPRAKTTGVAAAVGLVRQDGEVAAELADARAGIGDVNGAKDAMKRAEDRISGTICTGTHRIMCRGIRAQFRDRVMAPIHRLRTRIRIDRAVAMVNSGRFEQAVELANEAGDEAAKSTADTSDPAKKARVRKDAAQVEYAVRLAWARSLEGKRAWADARDQYQRAADLWQAHKGLPMAQAATPGDAPPHTDGLERTAAVAKALDETSSVLDKLTGIGLGDQHRQLLHERILKDPTNPRVYAELALEDARAARDGRLDPETATLLRRRSETWIETSRKVAPGEHMPRFYDGVLRFLRGEANKGIQKMRRAYRKGYRDAVADLYLGEALSVVGRHKESARHWKRAWRTDRTRPYALLRAVESMLADRQYRGARELVDAALKRENAFDGGPLNATHHGAQAIAMMHLYAGEYDAARKVLVVQRPLSSPRIPAVERGRSIAAATFNRLGPDQMTAILRRPAIVGPRQPVQPGAGAGQGDKQREEVLDRFYAYDIPAESPTTGTRVQCALLVFTNKRLVVVRWDAAHDYRGEIRTGIKIARRAVRLGRDLAGDWARLNLGVGGIHSLLDQIAGRPLRVAPIDRLDDTTELVIDSLDLFDRLRTDIERHVDPRKIQVFEVPAAAIVAWTLTSEDAAHGRHALHARRRDGRSPWRTEGDKLFVMTDSPAWLRALLRRYLDKPAR